MEIVGAQYVGGVFQVVERRVGPVETVVCVVGVGIVGVETVAHLAILAIRTVVSGKETAAAIALVCKTVTEFVVETVIFGVHAVVELCGTVVRETSVETESEIMSVLVEFLGEVGTEIAEETGVAGAVVGGVAVGVNSVGLALVESAVNAIIGHAAVERAVHATMDLQIGHGVNFIVDVHKQVAAEVLAPVRRGVGLVTGGVVGVGLGAVHTGVRPAVRLVVAERVAAAGKHVYAEFLLGPHI